MTRNLLHLAAVAALVAVPCTALAVSTNPDTPTTLKTNVIVGHMNQGDGKSVDNYYTFSAGPGTVKVRVTLRAGTDAGQVQVGLTDQDGTQIPYATCGQGCFSNNVVASGQGDATTTGTFTIDAKKTVVMHVNVRPAYYHDGAHPTYRIQLDGAVSLDKTAKPLTVNNR
jgi:hypothetical protein